MEMIEHRKLMNGDKIDISVPTGNFGNILAAFYAREMGLPVSKLICASNMNNVLTDFINTGIYDKKREFYKTVSPSMDILISSNLERFLFAVSGGNPLKIVRWFDDLKSTGEFKVDDMTRQRIGSILFGDFATEEDTFDNIKDIFNRYGYLIDTHTSVGVKSLADYRKSLKTVNPAIICGTASPYKFNSSVYYALTGDSSVKDEFILQKLLKDKTGASLPRPIEELEKLERAPRKVIAGERARDTIKSILSPERKVRLSLKKQD
jgi:threonine synthase